LVYKYANQRKLLSIGSICFNGLNTTIQHSSRNRYGATGLNMRSRAMHSVYTESFGSVAPYRLAGLGLGVAPNGVVRLGQNFLCKPNAWRDLVVPDGLA
jgi:hypothetical protein